MPDPLTGDNGQLISRLSQALRRVGDAEPSHIDLPVLGLGIDLGLALDPSKDLVKEIDRITNRMWELLRDGVGEDFLVAAARNRVTQYLDDQANDIEKVNRTRTGARQRLLDLLDDPDRFRSWAAEHHPGSDETRWTDAQVAAERKRVEADPHFAELDADDATRTWAARDTWAAAAADLLPDAAIEGWRARKDANRMRRRG